MFKSVYEKKNNFNFDVPIEYTVGESAVNQTNLRIEHKMGQKQKILFFNTNI